MMMTSTLRALLLLPLFLGASGGGGAGVNFRFASYIGDHMVLQKEPAGAVVWGYGEVGGIVMVTLHQAQETIMKKIAYVKEQSETWIMILDPVKPGGPYNMTAEQVIGKERYSQTVYDVLFGDVWLCSGQSNMEMSVSQIFNASEEEAKAFAYPFIRILTVALVKAEEELEDLTSIDLPWSLPTPKNLGHGNFTYYSAVCWLFGRYLYDTLKYPIGLVSSSWGGTPIEAWSSWRSLQACGVPKEEKQITFPSLYAGPTDHSILWNSMIHPLLNMTLKGVVWYQGENNANYNTDLYNCTFPALIEDWRQAFHNGSQGQTQRLFPFGFVQLSTTMSKEEDYGFPRVRWHQTADLGYVPNVRMPNTFMAVAMDLCDRDSPFGSIHPRDKQTVAYRLHLGARAVAYGEKMLPFQGPLPEKIEILADKELLKLEYHQKIQVQKQDDKIYEISCCNNHQCKWIPVPMGNSSSQTLALKIDSCYGTVTALRYAWTTWPCEYKQCPIYNPSSALPAPPFIIVIPS
ncbi:sialate O-acetylesterase isoform X2 [Vombatus ursinus]|uniref:Sialic acid acetylesterase n=1 Tax=Vombatus ursinus TaxID=29139 RepID=A0A4X2LYJ0_VOMUR|nr:sialate O-acetylesterase isoform X2 [Vombatus ursinus]